MSRLTLEHVAAAHPTLGERGYGLGTTEGLLATREQFDAVCETLAEVRTRPEISYYRGAYELAHLVSPVMPDRFVSQGTFIAAAIACGFRAFTRNGFTHFNMTTLSLDMLHRQIWNCIVSEGSPRTIPMPKKDYFDSKLRNVALHTNPLPPLHPAAA